MTIEDFLKMKIEETQKEIVSLKKSFDLLPQKTRKTNMKVTVIKEHNGIPKGSVIHVEKELKNDYKGLWTSMMGSYIVKVKKKYCEIKI
jgi:hypothetical protein